MTPPPWYITDRACISYAHAMGWRAVNYARARDELAQLITTAGYRDVDHDGRELWRCTKRLGKGLRCVVDPHGVGGALLLWVGHGVPPVRMWMTPR